MNITEITVSKKVQEQQYEPVELSMTATLSEGDDVSKATDDLRFLVEYKIREESRTEKLAVIQKDLEEGADRQGSPLSEMAIKKRQEWLDKYNLSAERFNSLEFIK